MHICIPKPKRNAHVRSLHKYFLNYLNAQTVIMTIASANLYQKKIL
jgi:hypothetical protein